MRSIISIQQQLLPDLLEVMQRRYTILRYLQLNGTVGRRTLAAMLQMTERTLRSEVELLKEQGFIHVQSAGMYLSERGHTLVDSIEPIVNQLFGLSDLEDQLKNIFQLKQVVVVSGDSEQSLQTRKELGRAAAALLQKVIVEHDIIAVTGGSTMADVADSMMTVASSTSTLNRNIFVPARGGLGESVELQANTIASTMAKKTGGKYRLLHVPDHLSEEAYQSLIQEPNVQEVIDVIRQAKIVIHGIGVAETMATRRRMDPAGIERLLADGAMAEAFGYYFNQQGEVVHKMPNVGLPIEDIYTMETVLAVAGGQSKAKAIAAVMQFGHEDYLVTDEAAALEMLRLKNE